MIYSTNNNNLFLKKSAQKYSDFRVPKKGKDQRFKDSAPALCFLGQGNDEIGNVLLIRKYYKSDKNICGNV